MLSQLLLCAVSDKGTSEGFTSNQCFLDGTCRLFVTEKTPRHLVGADIHQIFVTGVVHHAFERDVAAVHDDVDGAIGADAVALQRPIKIVILIAVLRFAFMPG